MSGGNHGLRIKAVFAQAVAGLGSERATAAFGAEDAATKPAVVATDEKREASLASEMEC